MKKKALILSQTFTRSLRVCLQKVKNKIYKKKEKLALIK